MSGKTSPDQALHDMTLAMLYLTRFKESGRFVPETPLFRAWKSYDWDTLDKLSEEEFTIDRHGNKSLYLTNPRCRRLALIVVISPSPPTLATLRGQAAVSRFQGR